MEIPQVQGKDAILQDSDRNQTSNLQCMIYAQNYAFLWLINETTGVKHAKKILLILGRTQLCL